MNKNKKYILSLGAIVSIAAPIAVVVSCGSGESKGKIDYKGLTREGITLVDAALENSNIDGYIKPVIINNDLSTAAERQKLYNLIAARTDNIVSNGDLHAENTNSYVLHIFNPITGQYEDVASKQVIHNKNGNNEIEATANQDGTITFTTPKIYTTQGTSDSVVDGVDIRSLLISAVNLNDPTRDDYTPYHERSEGYAPTLSEVQNSKINNLLPAQISFDSSSNQITYSNPEIKAGDVLKISYKTTDTSESISYSNDAIITLLSEIKRYKNPESTIGMNINMPYDLSNPDDVASLYRIASSRDSEYSFTSKDNSRIIYIKYTGQLEYRYQHAPNNLNNVNTFSPIASNDITDGVFQWPESYEDRTKYYVDGGHTAKTTVSGREVLLSADNDDANIGYEATAEFQYKKHVNENKENIIGINFSGMDGKIIDYPLLKGLIDSLTHPIDEIKIDHLQSTRTGSLKIGADHKPDQSITDLQAVLGTLTAPKGYELSSQAQLTQLNASGYNVYEYTYKFRPHYIISNETLASDGTLPNTSNAIFLGASSDLTNKTFTLHNTLSFSTWRGPKTYALSNVNAKDVPTITAAGLPEITIPDNYIIDAKSLKLLNDAGYKLFKLESSSNDIAYAIRGNGLVFYEPSIENNFDLFIKEEVTASDVTAKEINAKVHLNSMKYEITFS